MICEEVLFYIFLNFFVVEYCSVVLWSERRQVINNKHGGKTEEVLSKIIIIQG